MFAHERPYGWVPDTLTPPNRTGAPKWLPMRSNSLVDTRQNPFPCVKPISSCPAQTVIFDKPFRSHTYAKHLSSPTNRGTNSIGIRTYKAVHSKRFEVARNHTYSQKVEEGPDRVISPTPNQVRFIPPSLSPNPINVGAPPSGVGGWVLVFSRNGVAPLSGLGGWVFGSSRNGVAPPSGLGGWVLGFSRNASGFSQNAYVRS
jgi:hypothetical protein